jgi:hypothetical protein
MDIYQVVAYNHRGQVVFCEEIKNERVAFRVYEKLDQKYGVKLFKNGVQIK